MFPKTDIFLKNKRFHECSQILPVQETVDNEMSLLKEKQFESCRLCLVQIQDTNVTLLDGIIKDMLEIILPELDLSICSIPAICKSCLETLKQSYNFKSSCLEVEDKVQDFVNPQCPNSVDLKQVLRRENSIFRLSENHVVCRTCLGLGEVNTCTKVSNLDGDPLKNMVEKCLPEVGIDLTIDPVICPTCMEQLEEQFQFIMQCLDTEEKIKYYCERKNIHQQIDLHSVFIFSMMDENEDVGKQNDVMEIEDLEEKDCTSIKIETVDGLENNTIIQNFDKDAVNKPNFDSYVDLAHEIYSDVKKHKIKNEKSIENKNMKDQLFSQKLPPQRVPYPNISEKVTFKVSKDDNGEEIITSETSLIDNNSDNSNSSENLLLETKYVETETASSTSGICQDVKVKNLNEKKDKVVYKNDSSEESDDCVSVKKRLVTRKCTLCNFKTKYNSRMKAHKTMNHAAKTNIEGEGIQKKCATHNSTEQNMKIKCRSCPFITRDPGEYKKHKEFHKKERAQNCNICGMSFIRPDFLKKHIENHKKDPAKNSNNKPIVLSGNPPKIHKGSQFKLGHSTQKNTFNFNGQFLKMFKCRICPYQTRMRSNLVKHSLTHKVTTEIVTHKCKVCSFETIQKENFLSHMQTHNDESKTKVMKCFLCSFQPKTEEALKQHVNMVHKSGTG